jgi:RNA polymerase sigma-70 factor (sigma-E family)
MRPPAAAKAAPFSSRDDGPARPDDARAAVTALYREHATGLIRLAYITSGSRSVAEDVVQEAFCGLYRRWAQLSDTDKALAYVRSSVLNGCRSAWRRAQRRPRVVHLPPAASAEAAALTAEDQREVVAALQRLPDRQREALVLRFYLDLTDTQIADAMRISPGTVRSTIHRGIAALGIVLKETS